MAEIEVLVDKKEILALLQKIPQLIDIQYSFEKIKYLSKLNKPEEHENFIYQNYEPIMKLAASSFRPFTGFTQANYDTLTRLKWRWLASKVDNGGQPQLEEAKGGDSH